MRPPYGHVSGEIMRRLTRRFELHISPNTFLELMDAIKGGDGTFFDAHKQRLRIMAGSGQPRFLPFPITFALKTILGFAAPLTELGTKEFKQALTITFRARTRDDLFTGNVKLPGGGSRRYGIDPELISNPMAIGEAQHVASLERLKAGMIAFPPPEVWAAALAEDVGCVLTDVQAQKMAEGLEAAYAYDLEIARLMRSGYNATKNRNDWIDSQQLFYLSDPTMHLITDDSKIRDRCKTSDQSNRIILVSELPGLLGVKL